MYMYIADRYIGRFDRIFWNGLQEVNSVLQNHLSSKTNEGKEKEQEGRERRERILLTPFLSLLYLFTQENTSLRLSSLHLKTQQPTHQSIPKCPQPQTPPLTLSSSSHSSPSSSSPPSSSPHESSPPPLDTNTNASGKKFSSQQHG